MFTSLPLSGKKFKIVGDHHLAINNNKLVYRNTNTGSEIYTLTFPRDIALLEINSENNKMAIVLPDTLIISNLQTGDFLRKLPINNIVYLRFLDKSSKLFVSTNQSSFIEVEAANIVNQIFFENTVKSINCESQGELYAIIYEKDLQIFNGNGDIIQTLKFDSNVKSFRFVDEGKLLAILVDEALIIQIIKLDWIIEIARQLQQRELPTSFLH